MQESENIHCAEHGGEGYCRAQLACNISKDSLRLQPPPLPTNAHKNFEGTSYIPNANKIIKNKQQKAKFRFPVFTEI